MPNPIQSIRGMNDLLPPQSQQWRYVEAKVIEVLQRYGYQPISFPIVEKTDLFLRSIGEVTDIVEKEMYSFSDRSDENITLRPEGTAGCVRAAIQNGLLNTVQRLWYQGPMFRYERPQKGRLRQFHQFGVEVFGLQGPDIDAEMIAMTAAFWRELGVSQYLTLQVNSLGTAESRQQHRQALQDFLQQHFNDLDEDSQKRFETNPLRILDSKNPQTQTIVASAPQLMDYLSTDERAHFDGVLSLLESFGIQVEVNPRLVRGLDYYTHTVFEWVTDQLGAQGTVCGGGRYNGLTKQLGTKQEVPGLGFGMGIERLMLLVESCNPQLFEQIPALDVYVIIEESVQLQALAMIEQLRQKCTALTVQNHCGGGSIKNQMKKADKSGATTALILGIDEINNNYITVKPLRVNEQGQSQEQQRMSFEELINFFKG